MTNDKWMDIMDAYRVLEKKSINKVEGNGWIIYRVGKIIRIDINEQ